MARQRAGSDLYTGPTGLVAGDKAAYGAVTESLGPPRLAANVPGLAPDRSNLAWVAETSPLSFAAVGVSLYLSGVGGNHLTPNWRARTPAPAAPSTTST